jgi:hypothetical protein
MATRSPSPQCQAVPHRASPPGAGVPAGQRHRLPSARKCQEMPHHSARPSHMATWPHAHHAPTPWHRSAPRTRFGAIPWSGTVSHSRASAATRPPTADSLGPGWGAAGVWRFSPDTPRTGIDCLAPRRAHTHKPPMAFVGRAKVRKCRSANGPQRALARPGILWHPQSSSTGQSANGPEEPDPLEHSLPSMDPLRRTSQAGHGMAWHSLASQSPIGLPPTGRPADRPRASCRLLAFAGTCGSRPDAARARGPMTQPALGLPNRGRSAIQHRASAQSTPTRTGSAGRCRGS